MRVGLFVPCYVDQLAPEVAWATVRVLERHACEVVYDPDQTCCGQPLLNLGEQREAAALARAHLRRFEGLDAVVCPSGSCVATVRAHYGTLGVEGPARARTFELAEFLVGELGLRDPGVSFPHRVALLWSCHGLRELALGAPSERATGLAGPGPVETLLRAVGGIDLVLPERPDECCGFGGAFSVEAPVVSVRIGMDRLRDLAATGAEFVTGTDVSCLLHLEGIRRRTGAGPRPIHLAQILEGEPA